MRHSEKVPTKTKGGVVHPMTARAVAKLGADISLARRARRIAAKDFADRAGISRATLHRLENGDAGISLNTLAMALHVLGRLDRLSNILDPTVDDVGLMQMRGQVPKRIARAKVFTPADDGLPAKPEIMEW